MGAAAGSGFCEPDACESATGAGLVTTGGTEISGTSTSEASAAGLGPRWAPAVDAAGLGVSFEVDEPLDAGPRCEDRAWLAPEDDDPAAPDEPLLSAKANGIEAMPAPTPRAKASAPTRPTYRAYPEGAGFSVMRLTDRVESAGAIAVP